MLPPRLSHRLSHCILQGLELLWTARKKKCQEGSYDVRKVFNGVRKVPDGVGKVSNGVRKVTHGFRKVSQGEKIDVR